MELKNNRVVYTKFERQPSSLAQTIYFSLPSLVMQCLEKGAVLAGGAVRSALLKETPADYDLYFLNQESYDSCRRLLQAEVNRDYKRERGIVSISENSETFSFTGGLAGKDDLKVQLIRTRIYQDIEDVMLNFDFTVCQAAIAIKTKTEVELVDNNAIGYVTRTEKVLITSEYFFSNLLQKKLVLSPDYNVDNVLKAPPSRDNKKELNLMARYLKYIGKGFIPDRETTSTVFKEFIKVITGKGDTYAGVIVNCIKDTEYLEDFYDQDKTKKLLESGKMKKTATVVCVPVKVEAPTEPPTDKVVLSSSYAKELELETDDTEDEYDPYECTCCCNEEKGQP